MRKSKTDLEWDDVRYFLGVARTGSLTKTASELRVSQSTVSRRIAALERSLGTRLFARHQTGYYLTDEGRDGLSRAEAVEDSVLAFERGAAGRNASPTGTVRLATAENLATGIIVPALPRFTERYPGIDLELVTGTDAVALGRYEADIALRLLRPEQDNLTRRKVGTMAYAIYGSRAYVRQRSAPKNAPLKGRKFVTWDTAHGHLPAARWLARAVPNAPSALMISSLTAQVAAVRAGIGLAVLPCFLATGRELVPVVPPAEVFSEDMWLVTHSDLTASARVQAVGTFLNDIVAQAQPILSGRAAQR